MALIILTPPRMQESPPPAYLLIENPRKSNNLGPLLRCANAFGITTIVAVGYASFAVEGIYQASTKDLTTNVAQDPTAPARMWILSPFQ